MYVVGSTIYEGSDESKSKTGSTDSQASSHRSSSTASSAHSAHSATSTTATHNWSAAASAMLQPCPMSVTEDVASEVFSLRVSEMLVSVYINDFWSHKRQLRIRTCTKV